MEKLRDTGTISPELEEDSLAQAFKASLGTALVSRGNAPAVAEELPGQPDKASSLPLPVV